MGRWAGQPRAAVVARGGSGEPGRGLPGQVPAHGFFPVTAAAGAKAVKDAIVPFAMAERAARRAWRVLVVAVRLAACANETIGCHAPRPGATRLGRLGAGSWPE